MTCVAHVQINLGHLCEMFRRYSAIKPDHQSLVELTYWRGHLWLFCLFPELGIPYLNFLPLVIDVLKPGQEYPPVEPRSDVPRFLVLEVFVVDAVVYLVVLKNCAHAEGKRLVGKGSCGTTVNSKNFLEIEIWEMMSILWELRWKLPALVSLQSNGYKIEATAWVTPSCGKFIEVLSQNLSFLSLLVWYHKHSMP